LIRAGLVVERQAKSVRQEFLSVSGIVFTGKNLEIRVFLYPDSMARSRDTRLLDTLAVAPPGKRIVWKIPATLVVSNNLAAIILTPNGRTAERVALALGAGMPLPPPRRG
jgi:hypothetical protein